MSVPTVVARSISGVFGVLLFAACAEPTAPVRRFAVLDDVGESDWQSVTVGGDHSCGIKLSGAGYCWGSNTSGQLGIARFDTICVSGETKTGCSMTPAHVSPGRKFMSISAGARHTCAITTTREAYCWGANDQGQVGDFAGNGPTLAIVPSTLGWTQISAGFSHTCAVRTDGTLWCWGSNDRGQLGDGTMRSAGGMVRVPLTPRVASVATGQSRTCARTVVGTVYCWGAVWTNRDNGLEFTRAQTLPERVLGAPLMSWLSVGSFTTCGADLLGVGYCWEANPRGAMGTGNLFGSATPQPVGGNLAFVQVSAGLVQSCGVTANGAGYCWGDNTFGQLGVSPTLLLERCGGPQLYCSTLPIPVYGRQHFTDISTGFGSHTCGVTTRGNLYCWGLGVSGQRGDGTASYATSTPTQVAEPTGP